MTPTPLVGAQATASATNRRNQLCEDAMRVALKNPWYGNPLFPNVPPSVQPITIAIPKEYFIEHAALKEFPDSKFPANVVIGLSVVFCIAYRPSFDNTTAYYTSYIIDVKRQTIALSRQAIRVCAQMTIFTNAHFGYYRNFCLLAIADLIHSR